MSDIGRWQVQDDPETLFDYATYEVDALLEIHRVTIRKLLNVCAPMKEKRWVRLVV